MAASTPTNDRRTTDDASSRTRRTLILSIACAAAGPAVGADGKPPSSVPAPSRPSSPTINSLDTIVSDMRLKNDLPLRGYEDKKVGWYVGPGYVMLGNVPRTTNMPQWFKDGWPHLINPKPMRALLPWIVIFDAPGHAAINTRVQVRNMRAYWKSRTTGEWRLLGLSPGVSGFETPKSSLHGGNKSENKRANPDGSVEIKPPIDPKLAWHGWWNNGRATIDPDDIEAWFVTAQARLVVDDPSLADDRDAARLLVQMGADYYYDANWTWNVGAPGVGISRSKRVRNEWQAFNMFTFTDVGIQEPGGGISERAFRAKPPPLE